MNGLNIFNLIQYIYPHVYGYPSLNDDGLHPMEYTYKENNDFNRDILPKLLKIKPTLLIIRQYLYICLKLQ